MGGALPNAIVIGAQKCGTTALHSYLAVHPQVSASEPKELDFFIERGRWQLGVEWYRGRFDPSLPIRVEASPQYTAWPHHDGVPKRMASVIPDAKLLFIVRDPIARIEAQLVHNYAAGLEHVASLDAVLRPGTTYIARSLYFAQLEQFLHFYERERIFVLDQTDLRDRRVETLNRVFSFLGIDAAFTDESFVEESATTSKLRRPTALGRIARRWRRSANGAVPGSLFELAEAHLPLSRPIPAPNLRHHLPPDVLERLRVDAGRLREFTGRSFADWSIWSEADRPAQVAPSAGR